MFTAGTGAYVADIGSATGVGGRWGGGGEWGGGGRARQTRERGRRVGRETWGRGNGEG
jgi:hypothetical protein